MTEPAHDTTKSARRELIAWFVERFPEVLNDDRQAIDLAGVLVEELGPLTQAEAAMLVRSRDGGTVSRQGLDKIEGIALKKCRLKGGRELRERWEHETADLVSVWDQLELDQF